MESQNGILLRATLDLDFALRARVTVGLDDITAAEFHALKVVRIERDRYESEKRP